MQNINISVCTVLLPGVESVQSVVAETFEITAITNFVDGFYWSFERRFAKISKSWFKVHTSVFTFRTLLRHYSKPFNQDKALGPSP